MIKWWFWVPKSSLEKKASSESCTVFKKSAAEENGDGKKDIFISPS
jgi:hypothetical protein